MANSFGSSGGFCSGSKSIVEHQRLSGLAYTYSASLPAMLTVAAIEAVRYFETQPKLLSKLANNSETMFNVLKKSFDGSVVKINGQKGSPLFHLALDTQQPRELQEQILQEIVELVTIIN